MSIKKGSGADLAKRLRRLGPECIDLMTARTDAEFEEAFDALLRQAVEHLEQNKTLFKSLNEDGLSGVLAGNIGNFGVTASREKHSNGHVDITIEVGICQPTRRLLGEAKIYRGPEYHVKGLEQLLGRYTTGREGRGLLIVYVRKKNIAGLVGKLREKMDDDLPMKQKGKTVEHNSLKWSFISTHTHSCGDDLPVSHIGCNLCIT